VTAALSRAGALAALAGLALMIAWPPDAATALAALPLVALMAAARRPTRTWAVATASVLLAYFSYGVMEILTNPGGRVRAVIFSVLAVTAFLAALDSTRRR
jgi:uncharacterized membrane protein